MKTLKLLSIICVLSLTLTACKKGGASTQIAKAWKAKEITINGHSVEEEVRRKVEQEQPADPAMSDADKTMRDSVITVAVKEAMAQLDMNNSTLTFNPDGTYARTMGTTSESGKWELGADGKIIKITNSSNEVGELVIESVSDNSLIINELEGENKIHMVLEPAAVGAGGH